MFEDKIAVPLLQNGEMDIVTEMLLFGEWQHSEEITRDEANKDTILKKKQKQLVKQEIFPKMI